MSRLFRGPVAGTPETTFAGRTGLDPELEEAKVGAASRGVVASRQVGPAY